jgi:hypothetical protein
MSGHGRFSPAFLAALQYRDIPGDYDFIEAVEAHLVSGYVVATPDYFILARPVERSAPSWQILNPVHRFESPDTWFIYLMAGAIKSCWNYYPVPYEWVGWQRRGGSLRFYSMEQIQRKATRYGL